MLLFIWRRILCSGWKSHWWYFLISFPYLGVFKIISLLHSCSFQNVANMSVIKVICLYRLRFKWHIISESKNMSQALFTLIWKVNLYSITVKWSFSEWCYKIKSQLLSFIFFLNVSYLISLIFLMMENQVPVRHISLHEENCIFL